ncbi:MAG TPA: hypothetical protein VFG22_08765 [Polyangiales bacterium]|nr:hypothetical protein [Polyangiales bacterium]
MHLNRFAICVLALTSVLGCSSGGGEADNGGTGGSDVDFTSFEWTELNGDAPWSRRAGLHTVELAGRFYLMGGRTPTDPMGAPFPPADFWADVWVSDDEGVTWEKILSNDAPGHWAPRAYFQAVVKGDAMYVLGGQDFGFPTSNFYSDVWSSEDGIAWTERTADAGWEPRAGLRAVTFQNEIYIFGGSQFDDNAILPGPSGPARIYYNDVWKSADGAQWQEVTANAPWEPRAGAVVVVKDDYMYLLGGEAGFLCDTNADPDCELPYFNDVWRSQDGADWELVTDSAGWSPRPGHQCAVSFDHIVCWGGFGLPENPMDVWVSPDGATWEQVSDSPWNAESPDEIKYDFEGIAVGDVIYTFGGDRETFDFSDPSNYLRVDNDVWRYALPAP